MAEFDRMYPTIDPYDQESPRFDVAASEFEQPLAAAVGPTERAVGSDDDVEEDKVKEESPVVRWDDEEVDQPLPSAPEVPEITDEKSEDPTSTNDFPENQEMVVPYDSNTELGKEDSAKSKTGRYFFYDSPLSEETGIWIPVSVPPMTENDHDEWHRVFGSSGGYLPEEYQWAKINEENDGEMTVWDVFHEMVVAASGKLRSFVSYDIARSGMSFISNCSFREVLKDMAQTLEDANFAFVHEILDAEPAKWLPDSASSACMLCFERFHPIMCSRHHCRYCGGLFCSGCSKERMLLPPKFRTSEPQRVCDGCSSRLKAIQPYLMNQISRASQPPTHDLTDLSTLRSWLNIPWARTMEYEIYKAANTIRGYCKVGKLKPEKSIPESILRQAKGLAILTVVKVGMMVTYKVGTGLVIARRDDGSWSPPSAISTLGVGWGAQAGGELADFIIVLRNKAAIKTFSGHGHLSVGAGVGAAAGIFGRVAEADFRAGDGGYAACYTYSCSKGAFVGCALNGSLVSTRASENARFYGGPVKASDILLGSMPLPPAASTLYKALEGLYKKIEN